MHLRAQPPLAAGTRRASVRLLLWLAPAVAISAPSVAPEIPLGMSRPYLAIVGSPALRFAERVSNPPDSTGTAGAPPQPVAKEEPTKPGPETSTPAETKTHTQGAPDISVGPETNQGIAVPPQPAGKQPSGNPPVPILPDDTRAKVRPEDFLPFFQFPGIYHELNNPNPPPTQSSATYRQT